VLEARRPSIDENGRPIGENGLSIEQNALFVEGGGSVIAAPEPEPGAALALGTPA
jgi:hypothetical protein